MLFQAGVAHAEDKMKSCLPACKPNPHEDAPRCTGAVQVDCHIGPAAAGLDRMLQEEGQAGSYDFAFVDADKRGYRGYHEQLLKVNRRSACAVEPVPPHT